MRNTYAIFKADTKGGNTVKNMKFVALVKPTSNSFQAAMDVLKDGNAGYVRGVYDSSKFTHITGKKYPNIPSGVYFVLNTTKKFQGSWKQFTIRKVYKPKRK
jgi:hypothetical protein